MGLAEILAAKKAKEQQAITPAQAVEQQVAAQEITPAEADKFLDKINIHGTETGRTSSAAPQEAAKPATGKPLTFAEKMALKKQQNGVPAVAAQTTSDPVIAASTTSATQSDPKVVAPTTQPAPSAEVRESTAAIIPAQNATGNSGADTATAQAYADIAERIKSLSDLSDTPLEHAMRDLKKALLANPNAVSLMMDSDYGQMVIALRRLVQEDTVEAAKEKSTGRKKKVTIDMTDQAAVEKFFDEL